MSATWTREADIVKGANGESSPFRGQVGDSAIDIEPYYNSNASTTYSAISHK